MKRKRHLNVKSAKIPLEEKETFFHTLMQYMKSQRNTTAQSAKMGLEQQKIFLIT